MQTKRRVFSSLILVVAIVCFLALVWSAARQKSETYDEGLFIGGGVLQILGGDPNFDFSHTPLLRWLAGVPALVFADAKLPPQPAPMVLAGEVSLADYPWYEFTWFPSFFYDADHDHERVLFWGRLPFALLAVAAGLLIFGEVGRAYGRLAALGATAVFLFTPEVLAHAQWAHSDMAAALTTIVVAVALARATELPAWKNDVILGGALGVAALAKIPQLVLVPVAVIVVGVFDRQHRAGPSWRRLSRRFATIALALWAVIVIGYLPQPRLLRHEFAASDIAKLLHSPPEAGLNHAARSLLSVVPLPDTYLKGVVFTKVHAQLGRLTYFHGKTSSEGWWYYYPVAIVLKYPTPLLLLALAGLAVVVSSAGLSMQRKIAWTVPPLAILALTLTNRVQTVGVRSVLPLAVFFAIWCGAALAAVRGRVARLAVVTLLASSIASGMVAYPDFLGYFNPLAGGTRAADRWLVDANIDWGQDLPALAEALERNGVEEVRLAYLGTARPGEWGIPAAPPGRRGAGWYLMDTDWQPGWYALSRSLLSGWWPPEDPYAWLRKLEPVEIIGGSIALFEVKPEDLPNATRRADKP